MEEVRAAGSGQAEEGKMAEIRRRYSSMSNRPVFAHGPVAMAGPMQPDDPLHFVNLSIACATAAFSCAGMFVQQWFTGHRQRTAIDAQHGTRLEIGEGLMGIPSCDAALDWTICSGTSDNTKLFQADSGMVTVAKSLGTAGMVLAILNVLLQIAGIATKHSNSALNKVCFGLCILCGLCMMIAGMWCNQYVLYARQGRHDNGSLLVVESSGPGLLLLCVVTSAVNVVFLHVVSHGPGPVSTQTRFLYKVPADEIEGKESATAQAEAAHRLIAEAPPEDDPEASSAV